MSLMPTSSIRRFLLTAMTAALLLSAGISVTFSWLSSKTEMYEVYEANLVQVAKAIAAHQATFAPTIVAAQAAATTRPGAITAEEDFFVRITDDRGGLRYVSHPDIHLPVSIKPGFHNITYQQQPWRVYVMQTADNRIEVAQSLALRQQAVNEVARSLLIPQLSFIPLFGLFIWMIVGVSLKPLAVISGMLEQRRGNLLHPLSTDKIPVEILPLTSALNTLLRRAERLIAVLRQFTSDAAHELRTPLTALKLQVTLLKRAADDRQRDEAITQLEAGIERATTLVQQLLTLARVEPDAADIPLQKVDLFFVVTLVIEELLPFATLKHIDLGMEHRDKIASSATFIQGDAATLKILLGNIINNAILYTPEYGKVDIGIYKDENIVSIHVTDTGPGILKDEIGNVFDRFYRGQGNTQSGSGLGLAIAQEIAHRHGASISLENLSGRYGLKVKIIFPV